MTAITPARGGSSCRDRERLRLSLHPDGVAPRIVNIGEWRAHLFARLGHQVDVTADPVLVDLLEELRGYPVPDRSGGGAPADEPAHAEVVVPLRLLSPAGILSFISTTTVFGTPVEVTLSELALETFFPAAAALLRGLADATS